MCEAISGKTGSHATQGKFWTIVRFIDPCDSAFKAVTRLLDRHAHKAQL